MKSKKNLQKWRMMIHLRRVLKNNEKWEKFTKMKSERNLQKWKVREIYKNKKWEKFTKIKSEKNLQKWKVQSMRCFTPCNPAVGVPRSKSRNFEKFQEVLFFFWTFRRTQLFPSKQSMWRSALCKSVLNAPRSHSRKN